MQGAFEFIGMSVVFGIAAGVVAWATSFAIRLVLPSWSIGDQVIRAADWASLNMPSIRVRKHTTIIVLSAHDAQSGLPVAHPLVVRRFFGMTWRTRLVLGLSTFSEMTAEEEKTIWPEHP